MPIFPFPKTRNLLKAGHELVHLQLLKLWEESRTGLKEQVFRAAEKLREVMVQRWYNGGEGSVGTL